ncbi:hypothetical protein [Nocardia sp. NRRL S-836]|uniref:hypothetical protein n=1 Tax=Nocardia sp. NRRL S-836 TaxID=1519492 RepID=UPI0006AF8F5D|nr:hypothetical protein [Nocardia sp. NRRL S-836]KOV85726.1 hypothetical protein ADL03_10655 [Nocardia sp. NRRL S-836]
MTLASRSAATNHADDERSVVPADLHPCTRRGEGAAENLWSTIRHHTSSWSLLWRLLTLALGVAMLLGAATVLMWLLGMRAGIAGFEVAPAG